MNLNDIAILNIESEVKSDYKLNRKYRSDRKGKT